MSSNALAEVERTCAELSAAGRPITFTAVAARAKIGRATLYRNTEIRAVVDEHRTRQTDARTYSLASLPKSRTCERSSRASPAPSPSTTNNSVGSAPNQIGNESSGRSLPQVRPRLASQALNNALMESNKRAHKTELINTGRTWTDRAEIERETAAYVFWFNTERLHSSLHYYSPVEYDTRYREEVVSETEVA